MDTFSRQIFKKQKIWFTGLSSPERDNHKGGNDYLLEFGT